LGHRRPKSTTIMKPASCGGRKSRFRAAPYGLTESPVAVADAGLADSRPTGLFSPSYPDIPGP
jgi:hypothetical protein